MPKQKFSDKELKEKLTPEEFQILRKGGTEAPFTGELYDHHEDGIYQCKVCGQKLFSSDTKYDSKSGWPSFWEVLSNQVVLEKDNNHGMNRTEVKCANCNSHLGHLFDDGPEPTGKRYCINSACLKFALATSLPS